MVAIEAGTFNFAQFFPESKHAKQNAKTNWPTFGRIAEQWLELAKRNLAMTTYLEYARDIKGLFSREYFNTIENCVATPLEDRVMADISATDMDAYLASLDVGPSRYNHTMSLLNQIYEYATDRPEITGVTVNRMTKRKFLKAAKPKPEPLTLDEIKLVLADMAKHYPEQIEIYFSLAFMIGFRPSEGIALKWSDVDWNEKTIHIRRARAHGVLKATKTEGNLKADEGDGRVVEVNDKVIALLKRLKAHTFLQGEWLFTNQHGTPWTSVDYLCRAFWNPTLKRCGIPGRHARQTRHTCATIMLMSYAEVEWCARQLGHSPEMFRQTYSKWQPKMDKRRQLEKFSAMFDLESELKVGAAND